MYSIYKVGDKVKIVSSDKLKKCRWYVSPMKESAGKVFTILRATCLDSSNTAKGYSYIYNLTEDEHNYNWPPEAFEISSESDIPNINITKKITLKFD